MKGFLFKILKFFLILLIAISAAFGMTYMLSYHNARNIKLDKDVHVLICGDSHTKTALNDSVIPNSLNIAHSSEHYLYSYNVLRVLLGNNPQIKTVILGLSYHNLSAFYDDYIFDQDMTQYMYPRYATVLDANSFSLLLNRNFEGITTDFKDIYHGIYRHINAKELDDYSFIGWFYKSNRSNLNDSTVNKALNEHFYNDDGRIYEASTQQLGYLEKIIGLCDIMDVRLLLINCPLSNEYQKGIPESYKLNYEVFTGGYKDLIWDHHDFIVPDSCWGDGDHLNLSGSAIFSDFVIGQIGPRPR